MVGRNVRSGSEASESSNSSSASAKNKPDISLFMECVEEELSDAQNEFYSKKRTEFKDVMMKLEDLARSGAKVTPNSDQSVTFRLTESSTTLSSPVSQSTAGNLSTATVTPAQNLTPVGPKLLIDTKTGRILGSIPPGSLPNVVTSGAQVVVASAAPGQILRPVNTLPGNRHPTPQPRGPTNVRARNPTILQQTGSGTRAAGPRTPAGGVRAASRATPSPQARVSPASTRARTPVREQTPGAKVVPPPVVDLTKPGVEPKGAPPLRKAFPALSVQAKAQRTIANAAPKRTELDAKVKALLLNTPAKFTEWLIQQGLVRSEQYGTVNGVKTKLKLGMYSDGKKFPFSGGYVWLHEGGDTKYTNVFRGSIFESGTGSSPTVIIKLLYHWACQTNIPNVSQWVKVDNHMIDRIYQAARCITVAAVQDEVVNMGGPGRVVEIGVISLGTSTQDGARREVRVEVVGVLDRSNRNIRLRASEPTAGCSQQERFTKIFEALSTWVHKSTKIVTDYSVDKETLHKLGYRSVQQCSLGSINASRPEMTNQQVMEYLKKIVPKMFQNTLSNLNNSIIQQFLDELSFREMFGQYPLACFDSLLSKISAQTQACALKEETMDQRIQKIAANPYLDWRYSERLEVKSTGQTVVQKRSVPSPAPTPKQVPRTEPVKRPVTPEEDADALVAKKLKVIKETVKLEAYYYATLQGEEEVLAAEFKADMAFKCHVCKKVFMNNIDFMKHLHLHVESDRATAIDFADLTQCKYCYKDFDNQIKMQEHLGQLHNNKGSMYVCQICILDCSMTNRLIVHMSREHVKAEMPYCCQVCGFRTSVHRDIIDHFHENHDRTDKLQCPLCLKTYSLFTEKGYNSSAAVSFMQHLQKHEDSKKKNFNCKKCCLVFVNDQVLKTHLEKDHLSYKEFDEIEPYTYVSTDEPIVMPKPDERQTKLAAKKIGLTKTPIQQAAFAAHNLEDLAIYDVERERCCECERTMTQAGHYLAYLCCTKCRYSTCCNKAMTVHVQLFHSKGTPQFNLGKPIDLENKLFCCCGYSASSGNKLAKHLGKNGCRSAYPSLEAAAAARIVSDSGDHPAIVSPSDQITDNSVENTEVDKKKDEPLGFLGLKQTSENKPSTDSSKEAEEEEGDNAATQDENTDTVEESEEQMEEEEEAAEKAGEAAMEAAGITRGGDEDADDPDAL